MLSGAKQKRVWEGMLESEIRSNYFAELSGRYSKRQQFGTWATIVFLSCVVVSFLASLPPEVVWIRLVLAGCAAGTSLYLVLAQNDRKSLESACLHDRWSRLFRGFRDIWEDIEAQNADRHLKQLDAEMIEASHSALSLANDQRAMKRWQEHTERQCGFVSAA